MYDDLVNSLRICGKIRSADDYCVAFHDGCCEAEPLCMYELMDKAADAVEELIAKLNHADGQIERLVEAAEERRWIPVTERLPEAGERVLCYCRANIYEVMKMRTDGDWVYGTNNVYMHSFVTHWMPLPEPPKEET